MVSGFCVAHSILEVPSTASTNARQSNVITHIHTYINMCGILTSEHKFRMNYEILAREHFNVFMKTNRE